MRHRTGGWVWTGRAIAAAAIAGLAWYMSAVGLDQAGKLAAPIGLIIAAAALIAPYLLPAYQRPDSPPATPVGPTPGPDASVVIIADHGSVAAQHIGEVTMHPPGADPPAANGQAFK